MTTTTTPPAPTPPQARRDTTPATRSGTGPVLPLFLAAWRQRLRGVVLWCLGFAAVVLIYLPLFPSLVEDGLIEEQLAAMPEEMTAAFNITTMSDGAGYTQSTVYGLLASVLVIVFTTLAGSRAVASEEEDGVLDLYLSRAVSRRRLFLERWAQLLSEVALVALVVGGLTLALSEPSQLGLSVAEVSGATLGLLGLGAVIGTAALAAGAATGRRAVALGTGAVVGVGSYLANVVSGLAEQPWLRDVSPFDWAFGAEPLRTGIDGTGLALLLGTTLVLAVLGLLRFEHRDLQV